MDTWNSTSFFSFPSPALRCIIQSLSFPYFFSLSVIFFFTNSYNFLLPISRYLRVLPNFYCPTEPFFFPPPSQLLFLFSSNLSITVLPSSDPNTFSNPWGLTHFLRPFSVLQSTHSISTLNYGNQSDSCGHLAMDEISTSTSFASPSFLINSRTADDVNHYRNHPSPIQPLRCFFKNCHQSSTAWHKLSRQNFSYPPTKLFPALSSYPLWLPSAFCSLQLQAIFRSAHTSKFITYYW